MTSQQLAPASLTSGPVRLLRAVTVALLTVLVASACHVIGGGTIPSAPLLAVMSGAAIPLCWALSRRRWSVRELVGIFLLAQSGVHLLSMTPLSSGHHMGAMGVSTAMIVSHLVGGLALVATVRRGEQVLWSTAEALGLRPCVLLLDVARPPRPARALVIARSTRPVLGTWPHVSAGRAPPTLAAPVVTS